MSVRVDKGLKSAFKVASRALFGSTCNPIESWMAGVVGVHQNQLVNGVNPCTTIDIGEIRIERNLRERRKYTHTVEQDGVPVSGPVVSETVVADGCEVVGCVNKAIGRGQYRARGQEKPVEFRFCVSCFEEYKGKRQFKVLEMFK
jgi:hypothetical protein